MYMNVLVYALLVSDSRVDSNESWNL